MLKALRLRKRRAIALAQLVLICGTLANGAGPSIPIAAAADAARVDSLRSDQIPMEVVELPASMPIPGFIAPSVISGSQDSVVSTASMNGIPVPALAAYQRGAQIIDSADRACDLRWELLAAIGRVESDHGRYGGNVLTAGGLASPGIYGIALNGQHGTRAVADTDAGQLDRDRVFDRAVGPMQFLPSTWSIVKVDGDGDGIRNPQNINDAALGAAVYLCSGSVNLGTRDGQETAVYRYNHSSEYVNLVLRIMDAYSVGDYLSLPSGTYAGQLFSSSYVAGTTRNHKNDKARHVTPVAPSGAPATVVGATASGAPGGAGASPTKSPSDGGLRGIVTNLLRSPAAALPPALPAVRTKLQATAECLLLGINALDVRQLSTCVSNLVG